MPMNWPPASPPGNVLARLMRKTVSLVTVFTSIGPLKVMDSRGCTLKPSRVLMTSRSSQSEGRAVQSGLGKLICRPVLWLESGTVNRSLGKGPPVGLSRLKRAWTPAARVSGDHKSTRNTVKSKGASGGETMAPHFFAKLNHRAVVHDWCSVPCAHVCTAVRLFPCAWRTLPGSDSVKAIRRFMTLSSSFKEPFTLRQAQGERN